MHADSGGKRRTLDLFTGPYMGRSSAKGRKEKRPQLLYRTSAVAVGSYVSGNSEALDGSLFLSPPYPRNAPRLILENLFPHTELSVLVSSATTYPPTHSALLGPINVDDERERSRTRGKRS